MKDFRDYEVSLYTNQENSMKHMRFSDHDTREVNWKFRMQHSRTLSDIRLDFLDGERLGDMDMSAERGYTRRTIRRIIEKKVAQRLWNQAQGKGFPSSRFIRGEMNKFLPYIFNTQCHGCRQQSW